MAIRKAEYCASCRGVLDARRPIRLKDEPFATRRHVFEVSVEKFLSRDAEFFCLFDFLVRKLVFEPGNHPVSAINFDFGIVFSRQNRRIRRNERLRFDILVCGHLHGCRRPERQRRARAVNATRAERFATLVRARRHDGYSLFYAEIAARLFGDISDDRSRLDEFAHILRFEVEYRCGDCL